MNSKKIKFGDKEVKKKKNCSSKQAIPLDSVDLDKIVVSNKWKISDTTCKYLSGYLNNDVIQPLCVILPQMSGYIKYFDNGGKNMSFVTDDEKVYNYNCIPVIDIDSVLKIDNKRAYPQAYLEQCKYKLKKIRTVNFIDEEIVDEELFSENDSYDEISTKEESRL